MISILNISHRILGKMGIRRTINPSFMIRLSNMRNHHTAIAKVQTNRRTFKYTVCHSCVQCHMRTSSASLFSYQKLHYIARKFHSSHGLYKNKSKYTEEIKDGDTEQLSSEDEDIDDITDEKPLLEISGGAGVGHQVVILQPYLKNETDVTTPELKLEEAHALIETLPGWKVIEKKILKVKPNQRFLFGKQQMLELTNHIRGNRNHVSAIFLNVNLLKLNQLALFQGAWKVPVYDRYAIVLQIFKEHAQTKEAKLQIALAEIPFVRNRLPPPDEAGQKSVQGTSHTIKFGGFRTRYTQMTELLLSGREARIRKTIDKLKQQRELLRKNRQRKEFPTVAVVGYTNSGKTSLIKALTGDRNMEPRNQLFATLDVTLHPGTLANHLSVLYVDTIGFISDIPLSLVKAFSATLEDAVIADVILHVRNASHPDNEAQNRNVLQTLKQILPEEKMEKIIVVNNKADLLSFPIDDQRENNSGELYISAVTGLGLDKLRNKLQVSLLESCDLLEKKFRVPFDGEHLSWLYNEATVTNTEVSDDNDSMIIHTVISRANYEKFKHRFHRKRRQS